MPTSVKSLGIDQLPREERLALMLEIWDTIADEQPAPALSPARQRELARRAAEDDAAPDDVVPWEVVKAQTLARLRKP